ncbi:MAG: 23S rRNA (guanosine(2251)-2'-O)-methyltransferase RlmB [Erysipelotrichaceae bacterium]|nr:23S rRNA (guanosine(2251)-2'-O)-methyltransferase RlmB [Erysipelotrichaceae bacterium]
MSDIVYGKNSFVEALNNKRIKKAYLLNDSYFIDRLKKEHIEYEIANKAKLDSLTRRGNHQGLVAEVEEYKTYELEDIVKDSNGLIVVLDGLKDPHNLGAIIRTCECAGVDGIIYKKHNSVKLNDTVAKVASGALEYVKVVEATNLVNTLKKLKEKNYWIVGTDGNAKDAYDKIDYNMNTVIIIGSEGDGISRLVKEECDFMVKMPMLGKINSLNASVAAGIMIYNVLSYRQK